MADKLTPWFPAHIKPVRVGVYETDKNRGRYQHWNGRFWGPYDQSSRTAWLWQDYRSGYQSPSWRGLAHPPQSHNNPASCEKK